ncbi:MAG: polysaccharide deacetylase family protein [Acidobacteriota bacterium]
MTRFRRREPAALRFHVVGAGLAVLWLLSRSVLSPSSQVLGPAFTHGDRRGPEVALTFDDGPNEPYTGQILDILEARGVKATFFLVGENVRRYPGTVRREAALGMELGNHTMHHATLVGRPGPAIFREIADAQETIEEASGVTPVWFRPPHGFRDPRLFRQAGRLGLAVAEWSVMPKDWTAPGMPAIVQRVLNAVRPGDIILLHDGVNAVGGDRRETVEALPYILDGLQARGLKPVTLSQLAASGGRGLRGYRKLEGRAADR